MKKLLHFIVTSIVENPDDVVILEKQEDGFIRFLIKSNPEDIKIIIGKNGRTIRSIRELIKIKASLGGLHARVDIEETPTFA